MRLRCGEICNDHFIPLHFISLRTAECASEISVKIGK